MRTSPRFSDPAVPIQGIFRIRRSLPPVVPWAVSGALLLTAGLALGDALQPAFTQVAVGDVDGRTKAWGVGVANFDSDSHPDMIAGDTFGDIHFYRGDGNGAFTNVGVVINQYYHNAYALAVGDFNNDNMADFVLVDTRGDNTPPNPPNPDEGDLHLYLGNGDGTFQSTGFPQLGTVIGNAGTDALSLTAGDVDGDGDLDLITGEIHTGAGDTADIVLWRNQHAQGSTLTFVAETIVAGDTVVDPEKPPYYPPTAYLHAYGLALGDVTGDSLPDLLVGDKAHYLYVYENNDVGATPAPGTATFSPIRFETPGLEVTRPYAYWQLDPMTFNKAMPLAVADVNDDGLLDIVTGNAGTDGGAVSLWVNEGLDGTGQPVFTGAGEIGSAGTLARGLAAGQLNPLADGVADIVFGNAEGDLYALFPDLTDTDLDGVIDSIDNAPLHANAPRLDMNTDGSINHLDQLDNDNDGVGDPADDDDDDDGVLDVADNSPFVPNADQADADGDGTGDVSDPLNDTDTDGDLVTDGPFDAVLYAKAMDAKARWSRSDTHFIIRIDALGRLFQNEFTQTLADGAILTPAEWETQKNRSYNGLGDDPATAGYSFPVTDPPLEGGADCPITVVVIPRLLWASDPDPDPIAWINERIGNPNLEIGQHGTYHRNNTPLGDWKDMEDRNIYSSEFAGLTLEENFQLQRSGLRALRGEYGQDQWILHSGVDPATAAKVDWSTAANPLISYAPPYNTSDTIGRDATARLGHRSWSASIAEESGSLAEFFSPEGSHHEMFDQFGMFHTSADLEVDSEAPAGMTYLEYLQSITQAGLNTWLIEEVSWATRYCNDLDRLVECPAAPGGINRENNMVDPERWRNWMTLLNYAKTTGEVMTMGDYALAMQFDNAPTVPNSDQADADHDGIGDVIDDAVLTADEVQIEAPATGAEATLMATLLNGLGTGIPGQAVIFHIDTDGDGTEEQFAATTGADGVATALVTVSGVRGTTFAYGVTWDGGLLTTEGSEVLRIGERLPLEIVEVDYLPGVSCAVTVSGLDTNSTYRLVRSADLADFSTVVASGFSPAAATDTLTDNSPPATEAYYRVEEE